MWFSELTSTILSLEKIPEVILASETVRKLPVLPVTLFVIRLSKKPF